MLKPGDPQFPCEGRCHRYGDHDLDVHRFMIAQPSDRLRHRDNAKVGPTSNPRLP